jgi:hypothetical protein
LGSFQKVIPVPYGTVPDNNYILFQDSYKFLLQINAHRNFPSHVPESNTSYIPLKRQSCIAPPHLISKAAECQPDAVPEPGCFKSEDGFGMVERAAQETVS